MGKKIGRNDPCPCGSGAKLKYCCKTWPPGDGAKSSEPQLDREKAFVEDEKPNYLWCLHCERAYPYGEYRQVDDLQMCPYEGCGGDTVIDAWPWPKLRDAHGYPDVPEKGERYPLYPE